MSDAPLATTLANARAALLAARTPGGFWVGELSASALSTATAVFALSLHGGAEYAHLIRGGLKWLADHQSADGGWGDTPISFSNLSTTCLCWAALTVPQAREFTAAAERAENWIRNSAGTLDPAPLARAVAARYGKDRTFSVPIRTMLALSGRLGPDGWRLVPQLPFELAALPFWCFQVVRLPVVSYALPALIAIGQVKHAQRPTWNPVARLLRNLAKRPTLQTLRAIQPGTGGYLEATPLTAFVTMSLIGAGEGESDVVREGVRFLANSVRADGSWPIDTNLTTWVTTLAVNALTPLSPGGRGAGGEGGNLTRAWLLAQQYRRVHPFTRAAPGGWAWTDLPGGVPDADDTPGALLALKALGPADDAAVSAVSAGVTWLLDLQNADGGIPTFCRGWTGLPFDRSSTDLTAHALRALVAWREHLPPKLQRRIDAGTKRGIAYLLTSQRPDGSWAPLWFGNQHAQEVANLTYGTSRVLKLAEVTEGLRASDAWVPALRRGKDFLLATQNADGGWGGRGGTPSSIEETALAVEGLAGWSPSPLEGEGLGVRGIPAAVRYLAVATRGGTHFPPSPIGFYFANLWYYEKLYPIIFTVAALERVANLMGHDPAAHESEL